MKVKFLHIPKTAGTSVRQFLSRFYRARHICPARNNTHLKRLPVEQLRSYALFSGHFDWTLLDQVDGPCFTFSVLREPMDRVLSFYFFLRVVATKFDPDRLATDASGVWAAFTWSPDEFFCGGDSPKVRNHIDDLFDNFYAYYFAGRSYRARRRLQGDERISEGQLLGMAERNLDHLDGLYSTDDLARLQEDIIAACGWRGIGPWGTLRSWVAPLKNIKRNARPASISSRMADLIALGATNRTFDRIAEMTRLDGVIWNARFPAA